MITAITTLEEFNKTGFSLPILAMDVGFSSESKSCGVATVTHNRTAIESCKLRFAEAITHIIKFAESHSSFVLVLEAPLSSTFNEKGNPVERGHFEKVPKDKLWYCQAGASMSLAALHILRQLDANNSIQSKQVHLIEGFVVGDASGDHAEVAKKLLRSCLDVKEEEWLIPTGAKSISVLNLLGHTSEGCPVILRPQSV
ncbi:MAG: hypothetical protein JNL74_20700 [Fibrobacteres bacterium]|nr:hypothetical protein [Fibrobacterota bacterium]